MKELGSKYPIISLTSIHTGLHNPNGLIFSIMWYVGRRVEETVDAVAAVRPDHRIAVGLRVFLDGVAQLSVFLAWSDHLDGVVHAFVGDTN